MGGGVKGQRNDCDDVPTTLEQSSDEGVSKGGEEISSRNSAIRSSSPGNVFKRVHSAAAFSDVMPNNLVIRQSKSENDMCSALRRIERSATEHVAADESSSNAANPLPASWPFRTSSGRPLSLPTCNEDQGGERWDGIAKLVDTALQLSREKLKRATMEAQLQAEENDSLQGALKSAISRHISFWNFNVDDLVLFLLSGDKNVPGERIYRALHANCRNYFLSKENVRKVTEDSKGGALPDFILGNVIHIEMHTVGESDNEEAAAEFQLEPGTSLYYALTIVPWNDEPPPTTP